MTCTNCGAGFDRNEPRCPYCGMINPCGAEKDYLDKLDRIRKQTEDLGEVPGEEIRSELKKSSRLLIIILLVIGGIIGALSGLAFLASKHQENAWRRQEVEEMAFERQYFKELNALYDEGDDEAVDDFLNAHMEEAGSGALFDWEHADYYFYYYEPSRIIRSAREIAEAVREGEIPGKTDLSELAFGLTEALRLIYDSGDSRTYASLTGRDAGRAADFIGEAEAFLKDDLGLDDEGRQKINEACRDKDGYVSYKLCEKEIRRIYGE